jgi:DNA-binding transcriptional regulator YiaG
MPNRQLNQQDRQALTSLFAALGAVMQSDFDVVIRDLKRQVEGLEKRVLRIERDFPSASSGRPIGKSAEGYVDPSKWTPADIAALRKDFGLAVKDMAFLLKCAVQSVHNWENGTSVPKQPFLAKLREIKENGKRRAHRTVGKMV